MHQLVDTIRTCATLGVRSVLRTPANFKQFLLAENYPIGRWAADTEVGADYRRLFLTWTTKAPFLVDLVGSELYAQHAVGDFLFGGVRAEGLGAAFLLDGLSVSFRSNEAWDDPNVELAVTTISEGGEDLIQQIIRVRHASAPGHIVQHRSWISLRRMTDVSGGDDLWRRRVEIFPSLDFCSLVSEQLCGLSENDVRFAIAVKGLGELQEYCVAWIEGPFNPEGLYNVSLESAITLQKYGSYREILAPDGTKRQFSWHLKRRNMRIYFFPDPVTRRILVGYVGLHLPTVKYPR